MPAVPFSALGSTPRIVLDGLTHRSELVSIELLEARDHAATTAVITALGAVFVLLAGFAGTFTIAALVWHRDDRGLILGLVTLGYLLTAGAMAWWTVQRMKSWHPLSETRRQLNADSACLQSFFPAHTP